MKKRTGNQTCILCRNSPPIQNSHILPKFVIKWIKSNAPARHLRWSEQPNKPEQDAWTADYLCEACERLFSRVENAFKQEVFDHAVARVPGTFHYSSLAGPAVLSMFFRHLRFTAEVRGNASPELLDGLRHNLVSALDDNSNCPALYMVPLTFETGRSQGRIPGYNQYLLSVDGYWFDWHLNDQVFWVGAIKLPFLQLVFSEQPLEDLASSPENRKGVAAFRIEPAGSLVVPSTCGIITALLQSNYDQRSREVRSSVSSLSPRQQQKVHADISRHPSPEFTLFHEAARADEELEAAGT